MVSDQAYVQEERTHRWAEPLRPTSRITRWLQIVVPRPSSEIPAFAKEVRGRADLHCPDRRVGPGERRRKLLRQVSCRLRQAPMVIDGTMAIDAEGAGSVLRVNADVKASVPFVGARKVLPRSNSDRAVRKGTRSRAEWLTAGSPNRRQLTATVWGSGSVLSRRRRGGLAQRGRGREVLARSCAGSSPTR